MAAESPDVLVIGAGPTGLFMASELVRHGATVRIIDKNPEPSDKSKALAIHARTLEIFDNAGIADRFLEAGHKVYGMSVFAGGKRIIHVTTDELDSPYPFILILPQHDTELLLMERLASLGAHVERNVSLTELHEDESGVRATLVDHAGTASTCRASWVIGCDGAHSTVRRIVGIEYKGVDLENPFAFIDARIEWDKPDDEGVSFFSPDGVLAAIPVPRLGASYWRLIAGMETSSLPEELTVEFFERLIRERADMQCKLTDPLWMTTFSVRQRKVESYRKGRVFLAGDAAHCHSPVGGQGMNTGLQDAHNLAWKLGLVIRGKGRPELLDSYTLEREPIAAAILQGTERGTRAVALRNPVAQAVRNQVARFLLSFETVQQRMASSISEITIDYRKSPIVAEDRQSIFQLDLIANERKETPSLGQWREFAAGPQAGSRAPDVELAPASMIKRLFELLRSTRHTLLLFDGMAATQEGYENLGTIARHITERYGDFIDVHVIVPREAKPEVLAWDGSTILDPDHAVHQRYGASAECLYLIRPDGYIGFRAQPADVAKLRDYLESIFAGG